MSWLLRTSKHTLHTESLLVTSLVLFILNLSLAASLDGAQQMPLPSVSRPLSLFIATVLFGSLYLSCLTTEFHESKTSRNYKNRGLSSILLSSEDKDLASHCKKEFASKRIYNISNGKAIFMEKSHKQFSFSLKHYNYILEGKRVG